MAHPLLLTLANIATDIRSKGSLHGHLLLALLPVASFIHKKLRIRSLLSDQLVHHCLDLVLTPLKIAASIGVMMNDPRGNLRYCFMPLVGYIADTPEQSLSSANPGVAVQYWPVLDSVIVFIVRVHLCSTVPVSIVCPRTIPVPIVCPSLLEL